MRNHTFGDRLWLAITFLVRKTHALFSETLGKIHIINRSGRVIFKLFFSKVVELSKFKILIAQFGFSIWNTLMYIGEVVFMTVLWIWRNSFLNFNFVYHKSVTSMYACTRNERPAQESSADALFSLVLPKMRNINHHSHI